MAAIVIIGVLYLLEDKALMQLLQTIREHLQPGGVLVLSEDSEASSSWDVVYWGHMVREKVLWSTGFVKGQGVFLRSETK